MPKKYIHKKRGKTQVYEEAALKKAVDAVQSGMSIRKAAATFGVPRSTVGDRVSGRFHDVSVIKNGRPPCMPVDIETKIVRAVVKAARQGFGLTVKQVLAKVDQLCQTTGIGTAFKNFKAGKDWWAGVKRRHPQITMRRPEKLSSVRSRMMNKQVIQKYFDDLGMKPVQGC